jgi:hypothetical protein
MNGDEIRAYILLGCLVAAYPVLLGIRAIEKAMGPEVVVYDGCQYEVYKQYSYLDTMSIKPLDKEAETCDFNRKETHNKEAIQNLPYKELVKELRERERPNQ